MGQVQTDLPYSIRGVRDSLINIGGDWLFWVCLLAPMVLLLGPALWWWRQHRQDEYRKTIDDPEGLFEGLLNQVELAERDKQLLREMARQGRLRHPAMCLLSPALLDWSRQVWLTEKKPGAVPSEKAARIDEISTALYDHVTPTTARRVRQETVTNSD